MVRGLGNSRPRGQNGKLLGAADPWGRTRRLYAGRYNAAENRLERMQVRRGAVRVGVSEIRVS